MKNNWWFILGAVLSTSLLAQQATNPTPSAPIETPAAAPAATLTPAPAKTNAPVAKSGAKKSGKKKAVAKKKAPAKAPMPALKTVPLVPGPAVVVASNVNVRGQAKLQSEVLTRVTKGQAVTVIEEIVRNNSGPDEPSAWAKVVLPPNAHTWVNTMFIDSTNQTVKPKKLNVRSGPGENYSVIGLMHAGDAVKAVTTKGDWTEIEAPANAYGFMAAQYLSQEATAVVAAAPKPTEAPAMPPPTTPTTPPPTTTPPTTTPPTATPTEPAPTPATVAAAPPVAPPPTEAPAVPPPTETPAPTQPPAVTNAVAATPTEPAVEEPLPPRIVQREGIVRGMTSIQAPSKFALISPENGRNIDYLYTTSDDLDLRRYKGLRIIVTGEEGLDERWGNTPVLTIQKIQIVE